MIEFQLTITINRAVDEVFTFLADFENVPKWNYFVRSVRQTSAGPVSEGTTYHQVRKADEQNFRVTEYEPPHKIAVKTVPGSSPHFERRFTLREVENETEIVDDWKLDTGIPNLIQKLAVGRVKSGVAENLAKLKVLLETGSVVLQDGRQVRL